MAPNFGIATADQNIERTEFLQKPEIPQKRVLGERTFQVRESLLTELFNDKHFIVIYQIFAAIFLGLLGETILYEVFVTKQPSLGFRLIRAGFRDVHVGLVLWTVMLFLTIASFYCFHVWADVRVMISPKRKSIRFYWDSFWIFSAALFYIFMFRFSSFTSMYFNLGFAASNIVLLEQVRIVMKIHAFIRTNAPKVLAYKPHSDKELQLPKFSKFIYFFFAPTLIFKDEYPRTKQIRWKFVFARALDILGIIFFYSFIFERLVVPSLSNFGTRTYSWSEIIILLTQNTTAGILVMVTTFYMVLHAWQNMFAELLRFGDRKFYADWWTCVTYAEYYRKWNLLVSDWLLVYVYKDMYEIITPGNKNLSKFVVFLLSSVVHEFILIYLLKFTLPCLFISMLISFLLTFLNPPKSTFYQILFLYGLGFGAGLLVSSYTMEYYARANVPLMNPSEWDFYIPRFINFVQP